MDISEGSVPLGGTSDHTIYVRHLHQRRHQAALFEEQRKRHVADGEAHGRQRRPAKFLHQIVVTPATRKCAQLPFAIESLEDETRVIGEAAHNPEVNFDKPRQPPRVEVAQQFFPVRKARGEFLAAD